MVFWILITIIAVLAVIFLIMNILDDEIPMGIATFFVTIILGGMLGGIVILILGGIFMNTANVTDAHTRERNLTSLKTADQGEIRGNRYYLGSGIISGKSGTGYTYMYEATDRQGRTYYQLGNAAADRSRVYTDGGTKVDITDTDYIARNGWILPFDIKFDSETTYTFHVPEGSVVQQQYQAN